MHETSEQTAIRRGSSFFEGMLLFIVSMFVVRMLWKFKWFILAFWMLNHFYVYAISQQTHDMSGYIDSQQSKIVTEFISAREIKNVTDLHLINDVTVKITNTSKGRAYGVGIECNGYFIQTFPDPDYAPIRNESSAKFETYIALNPGESKVVNLSSSDTYLNGFAFQSDTNNISCHTKSATFEPGDFYRLTNEIDRWGMATIKSNVSWTIGQKPTTYRGNDYPVTATGKITNIGKAKLLGFTVSCYNNTFGIEYYNTAATKFDVELQPKESYEFNVTFAVPTDRPIQRSLCRVSAISQPWFYQ